jgi:hypothetical protein
MELQFVIFLDQRHSPSFIRKRNEHPRTDTGDSSLQDRIASLTYPPLESSTKVAEGSDRIASLTYPPLESSTKVAEGSDKICTDRKEPKNSTKTQLKSRGNVRRNQIHHIIRHWLHLRLQQRALGLDQHQRLVNQRYRRCHNLPIEN